MTTNATAQSFDPQERRKYLGASELSAILGYDRFKTALDVFREKTGLSEPFTGNAHTERGNQLEAIAAKFYTDKTGVELRRRTDAFVHPEHPFIVGHVDRVVVKEKRIVEIKCPSVAAFRKYQREGLPESFVIQANAYMGLAGFPKLTFVIFCADVWGAAIFDFDFDGTIYNKAIAGAVAFWNENVLTGTPPESDAKSDIEIEKGDGTVTFRNDEPFIANALSVREAIELKRDADELFEIAKKSFIEGVEGAPGIYECPGLRVHYNERPGRVSLDKKAMEKAGIDLTQYEKRGSSYKEFRPYILNSGEKQ